MLVITAAVPAARGALVIKALQQVVDGRKDEREAYYQSVLPATCRRETAEPVADGDSEGIGRAQVASRGSDGPPMHAAGNNSAAAESVVAGRARRWRDKRERGTRAGRMGGSRCFNG